MARGMEQAPAKPFAEWLGQRAVHWSQHSDDYARALAAELGWEGDAGVRRLFRYRRQQKGTSGCTNGVRWKADVHTDTFPRGTVEDALHMAGVDFASLYVAYAERLEGRRGTARDVLTFVDTFEAIAEELACPVQVREAWCIKCAERVFLDALGECQWCAGERDFKARLEQEAEKRRRYEREKKQRYAVERKQAA